VLFKINGSILVGESLLHGFLADMNEAGTSDYVIFLTALVHVSTGVTQAHWVSIIKLLVPLIN